MGEFVAKHFKTLSCVTPNLFGPKTLIVMGCRVSDSTKKIEHVSNSSGS